MLCLMFVLCPECITMLQVREVVVAMVNDAGVPLRSMRVDGGVARSDVLLQVQADLLNSVRVGSRLHLY